MNTVPGWIASGVLGLAFGIGGTVVTMQSLATPPAKPPVSSAAPQAEAAPVAAVAPGPGGMPGMGGGGPAMGMGGGGPGAAGKRNLTSLVGKLELLSRANLKLHVELDADQVKSIAEKLAALDAAETMTFEEAQSQVDELEALLTAQQKEALSLIGLPGGQRGGGGAPGAGGPPGAGGRGGPPGGAPPMGMMGMAPPPDPNANPFAQEANQKRLRDLLARLQPGSAGEPIQGNE
jgi:hypothetical protein